MRPARERILPRTARKWSAGCTPESPRTLLAYIRCVPVSRPVRPRWPCVVCPIITPRSRKTGRTAGRVHVDAARDSSPLQISWRESRPKPHALELPRRSWRSEPVRPSWRDARGFSASLGARRRYWPDARGSAPDRPQESRPGEPAGQQIDWREPGQWLSSPSWRRNSWPDARGSCSSRRSWPDARGCVLGPCGPQRSWPDARG